MTLPTPTRRHKARENDWRLFLKLMPYAKRNLRSFGIAAMLLIPAALGSAVQPILMGQAISLIRQEPSAWKFLVDRGITGGLQTLIATILVMLLVRLVLDATQSYLVQMIGQRVTADIRNDLFHHVTSLAVRFFDRTPVGKLITRLTSDVDSLGEVFSTGAIGIINDLVLIVIMTTLMLSVQWQLGLLLMALLIPMTALIIFFQKRYRDANYAAREELSVLNSMFQENINGINIVQLFRREVLNSRAFRQKNQVYINAVDKTIFYDSAVSATLEWISLAAIAAVLFVGSWLITGGRLDLGILATFVFYAQKFFEPLRQFAEKFTAIQAGFTAIERVSELMNEPIEIQDSTTPLSAERQAAPVLGEITFEHVWFGYKPDEYVLQDLNFTIKPGEKVALVGPTGAGKSSIIRLLSRLYEPVKGRILIDGIDIRELPQAALRQRVGIILQDGFIFAGDVTSNITLGEKYDFSQVKAAAAMTNVDRLIEQLPQGYDTYLRERGTSLSGGQKQLLAFARAAIREPKILVLDEATSSLDVGTEALIQEALERMLVDRTAIIIAHRLSTIRDVDRILVLKRGSLVESGSHDELLRADGLYASLYKLQLLGTEVLAPS
jgi:ATP-binding cassette, subfamily B, multidrug efflux pump